MYKTKTCDGWIHACAKKKTSIAKVKLCLNNEFVFVINNSVNDNRKHDPLFRFIIYNVFDLIRYNNFKILVNVKGGGITSQAHAIRLAVVKCLLCLNDGIKPILKANNYITTDCRIVERKKYGHRKSRKSYQFSKR
ncbi:30S ribosomal subunit protein S9 [Candidatus Hodgkinia cicadicola]|uniref:Small ribosomal subunit protein uS9 n=1 Tax=Candidatus Hodgkinia cicadicola TaxID=573658 RepID=A0ABX4MG87_9HYPH|nr:30S ribosomal subunit protein S9 [Candidatus Hodgkinia cicadicola]PIM95373.1 30S ribosomal subunit protein S9 [Candidatus Hodgkinia cicadicola]PIM95657.1 30S ribosomal subunit protein S9 [Candidatus Hodgkinia cicadicola]